MNPHSNAKRKEQQEKKVVIPLNTPPNNDDFGEQNKQKKTQSRNKARERSMEQGLNGEDTHKVEERSRIENPFDFFGNFFKYPISLFACLLYYKGAISGSASLQFFLQGSKSMTDESDIDIYLHAGYKRVFDICHILNISGIRWHNILSERLTEALEYGATVIPISRIHAAGSTFLLGPEPVKKAKLLRYLNDVLDTSNSQYPEVAEDFVSQFWNQCEAAIQPRAVRSDYESEPNRPEPIWIFTREKKSIYQDAAPVCRMANRLIRTIELPRTFDVWHETKFSFKIKETIEFKTFKKSWEKWGFKERLLRKLLAYYILRERPYYDRTRMYTIIDNFLDNGSLEGASPVQGKEEYSDYRILSGRLPNGRKVQLVLLDPAKGTVTQTVLRFYATNVMSETAGAHAVHFFFKLASEGISRELDFRHDPRHAFAQTAIEKYKNRGWIFKREPRTIPRNAIDGESKIYDFEKFYVAAFEAVGGTKDQLPKWWGRNFEYHREEVKTQSWQEQGRAISTIHNRGSQVKQEPPGNAFKWVQDTLHTHNQVIGKELWNERDEVKIKLDIWFAGVWNFLDRTLY
ncbi:hypothetical protein GQ44DRAFT_830366 [Phaeosphaeriaceae sp. PMI808]|nr:hypothetical protein GQ44DRAFT_830366 [Phaeosphaeriaceae sp. PMI808]